MSLEPLRIVHLAATPNGAPWLVSIVREQRRRGHDVTVILNGTSGTLGAAFASEGVPCRVAAFQLPGATSLLGSARQVLALARLLGELRADVVQYHLFESIIIGRLAAWLADAPLRFSMIPGTYYLEAPGTNTIDVGTAWTDTKIIASCERTRTLYVEQGVPRDRVELVYYGLDMSRFDPARADAARVRREFGLSVTQPVVGMVALFYGAVADTPMAPAWLRGRDIKGHDVLLRAMARVLARHPDAVLILVGGGWSLEGEAHRQTMIALAQQLGIGASVIFAGHRQDVPDLLMACDVAVQCSRCENLGGTIEALSMARPLVATRVGGMVDTTLHEETGLLVPADDVPALADAIARLLDDRGLATRLGEAGRRFMLDRFTVGRAVDDLDALYAGSRAGLTHPDAAPRASGYRTAVKALRAAALPVRMVPVLARAASLRFTRLSPAHRKAYVYQVIARMLPEPVRSRVRRMRRGGA